MAPKFDTLLKNTGINFVQSSVTDVRDGKVFVRSKYSDEEKCFPYDHLVIAAGAQPRTDIIPGAANFSLPFCRVEDAVCAFIHLCIFSYDIFPTH